MTKRSLLPDAVEQYVAQVATKETDIQQRLRRETEKLPNAGMQLGPDQGAFLAWLVKLIGAHQRASFYIQGDLFYGMERNRRTYAKPIRCVTCRLYGSFP